MYCYFLSVDQLVVPVTRNISSTIYTTRSYYNWRRGEMAQFLSSTHRQRSGPCTSKD